MVLSGMWAGRHAADYHIQEINHYSRVVTIMVAALVQAAFLIHQQLLDEYWLRNIGWMTPAGAALCVVPVGLDSGAFVLMRLVFIQPGGDRGGDGPSLTAELCRACFTPPAHWANIASGCPLTIVVRGTR